MAKQAQQDSLIDAISAMKGAHQTTVKTDPDPTLNVKALNAASILALEKTVSSGLKNSDRMSEMRAANVKELLIMSMAHNKELRLAETARIDAIRLVDTGNVTRAAEVSAAQATALATSQIQSAEALRVQVEATRITTQDALTTALQPIQAAIESLRQTQFQQQGEKSAKIEGDAGDRWQQGFEQAQALQKQFAQQFTTQQGEQRAITTSQKSQWATSTLVVSVIAALNFVGFIAALIIPHLH